MNATRIAAVIGVAVISVTAGTAGAAFAGGPAGHSATAAQARPAASDPPGAMTGICRRMMREYPAMAGLPGQTMRGTRGMGQMDQQVTGGGPVGMMGEGSAAMAGPVGR